MLLATIGAQVLLTVTCEGSGPVRFGVPLPASALSRGLRAADSDAVLQWRPLQERPDPHTGYLWVEVAVIGAERRIAIAAGGDGPAAADGGRVVARQTSDEGSDAEVDVVRHTWRWRSGEVDWCERRLFRAAVEREGELLQPGEAVTAASPDLAGRWLRVRVPPRHWRQAGVLPPDEQLARPVRQRLAELARTMQTLPGARGRGDYGRAGGVVTNLEFDTVLGFARLGLALGDAELLRRAAESARHLVDRDLDRRSGLPFRHGQDHRTAPPEPGHVWLAGLLLVACLSADDDLVRAARSMAHGLARYPAQGEGQDERLRDRGWPLLEMEAYLRFEERASIARAADALAADLVQRFDPQSRVLRFGEGERRGGYYEERAWLTGGVALPALRAHLARRPSARAEAVVEQLERRLLGAILDGRPGLPLRYWIRGGAISGQVRLSGVPEAFLLLEGLSPRNLARCLRRRAVVAALRDAPAPDDPSLATAWSMAARCTWVLR